MSRLLMASWHFIIPKEISVGGVRPKGRVDLLLLRKEVSLIRKDIISAVDGIPYSRLGMER